VGVLVDVVYAAGVERAGAALDAVHDVAFFEQQLGQVGAVLAGDAGDKGDFGGGWGGACGLGHVERVFLNARISGMGLLATGLRGTSLRCFQSLLCCV